MNYNIVLNFSNTKELKDLKLEKTELNSEDSKILYSKNLEIGSVLELNDLSAFKDIDLKNYKITITGGSTIGGAPLNKGHMGFNERNVKRDKGNNFFKRRDVNKNFLTILPKRISYKTRVIDLKVCSK